MTVYAGLATRTLAFALDALIINCVAWFVGAVIALGLSLIGIPDGVGTVLAAIGAAAALVWAAAYFVFFWSASGQTPGNRALAICVEHAATGRPPAAGRAALRLVALPLSALPLCAGFLLILVDGRRRALHDHLVGTVVVYAGQDRSGRVVHLAELDAEQHLGGAGGSGRRRKRPRRTDGHVMTRCSRIAWTRRRARREDAVPVRRRDRTGAARLRGRRRQPRSGPRRFGRR